MLFLSGRSTKVQEQLAEAMAAASRAMEFERAAAIRDRIRALTNVQANQGINPEGVEEADVVALHQEGGQACVQVFFIRAHQNWGNRAYFPRTGGAEPAEILEAFLGQFYDNKTPPRQILVSHDPDNADLLAEALSGKLGRRVVIARPRRGREGAGWWSRRRATRARRWRGGWRRAPSQAALLEALGEAFGLDGAPERIEVYDNSHIMGTNAVGGMIVAGPDGFVKSQYRKFNIRSTELMPGDDFGMMREVLTRRFARLSKEDPDRQSDAWPDLVLIDGGRGAGGGGLRGAAGARHRRGGGDRRGQGGGPRRRQGGVPPRRASRRWRSGIATRCSISSSGCATRRIASRSARTGRSGRRRRGRRRSTRCRGSARRASGRCSRISARPRRCRGRGWPI